MIEYIHARLVSWADHLIREASGGYYSGGAWLDASQMNLTVRHRARMLVEVSECSVNGERALKLCRRAAPVNAAGVDKSGYGRSSTPDSVMATQAAVTLLNRSRKEFVWHYYVECHTNLKWALQGCGSTERAFYQRLNRIHAALAEHIQPRLADAG